MPKHLYFICPTDHLETTITATFGQESFFYTSLANSTVFDSGSIGQIIGIVEKENINQITFVLSQDNQLILNAIRKHSYPNLQGICHLYNAIGNQISNLNPNEKGIRFESFVFSHYLDRKINELRGILNRWFIDNITINALIYSKENNLFFDAKSDFFRLHQFNLN